MQLLDKHWVGKEGTHTNLSQSVQSMEKSSNPQMLLHPKVTKVYKSDELEKRHHYCRSSRPKKDDGHWKPLSVEQRREVSVVLAEVLVKYRLSGGRAVVKYRPGVGWHACRFMLTDVRPSRGRHIDRVSVDISAECWSTYRPILSTDSRPTDALSTHDPFQDILTWESRKSSLGVDLTCDRPIHR